MTQQYPFSIKSWTVISDQKVVKYLDKSAFKEGSHIPKQIWDFFDLELDSAPQTIPVEFDGQLTKIEIRRVATRNDFQLRYSDSVISKELQSEYAKQFARLNENRELGHLDRPVLEFCKQANPNAKYRLNFLLEENFFDMEICESLVAIVEQYPTARTESMKNHPILELFKRTREKLNTYISKLSKPKTIEIKSSVGIGGWAEVPWIAILDTRETTSPRQGIYPVFLFPNDGSGVYLCIGLGYTEYTNDGRKLTREGSERLEKDIILLRDNLNAYLPNFTFEDPKNIGKYSDTIAAYQFFSVGDLPASDIKLSKTIAELIATYQQYVSDNQDATKTNSIKSPPVKTTDDLALPKNSILYGPPGTGKTHKVLTEYRNRFQEGNVEFVTFHQSYSYEDFVEGIKPVFLDDEESKNISYRVEPGVLRQIQQKCSARPNENFLLVIDEINRGNISKIFGELITLIEEDKREGKPNQINVILPYSKEKLCLPSNLYIVGTMNTADRSIALVDIALRRRFSFIEVLPDSDVIRMQTGNGKIDSIDIAAILEKINLRIEVLLGREFLIGHSYFLGVESLTELRKVFLNKVIPLLQEYFYEDWLNIIKTLYGDLTDDFPRLKNSMISVQKVDLKKAQLDPENFEDPFIFKISDEFKNANDEDLKKYFEKIN